MKQITVTQIALREVMLKDQTLTAICKPACWRQCTLQSVSSVILVV